jgi:uncharacterized membrane protein YhaH (DUF805 family)
MNLVLQPLRKYADFKGRARRAEFWLFTLGLTVLSIACAMSIVVLRDIFGGGAGALGAVALVVVAAVTLVPNLAVSFRRLHDTGHSAWWLLIQLVPFGVLVLLYFYIRPGTVGPNAYGPDPKQTAGDVAATFS